MSPTPCQGDLNLVAVLPYAFSLSIYNYYYSYLYRSVASTSCRMLYYIVGTLILILLLLSFYIYVKVTTGVCVSSRHLVGKVVLVTGGTSGIGYETAVDLAERGARVLVASNERHGERVRDTIVARSGNTDVHFIHLDLASLDSVRLFATKILEREKHLNILVNNAGVIDVRSKMSEDGFPIGIQVNYIGPFLLTNLLLPLLTSTSFSKIINVSSMSYKYGRIDFDNLMKMRSGRLSPYLTYSDSKLCVALMTVELSRRLRGSGVTANFLHPGVVVNTNILDKTILTVFLAKILKPFLKTSRQGAQTSIYLAVSSEVADVSGCYFEDCKVKDIFCKKVLDKDLARALWNVTERLVKKRSILDIQGPFGTDAAAS